MSTVSFWNCSSQSQTRNYQTGTCHRTCKIENLENAKGISNCVPGWPGDPTKISSPSSPNSSRIFFFFYTAPWWYSSTLSSPFLFFCFCFKHAFVVAEKVKRFFFFPAETEWVARYWAFQVKFPLVCWVLLSLQSIIVSVWLGWIYLYEENKPDTDLHKIHSERICQFKQLILKLTYILKNKSDTNKCHVRVLEAASLSVWPIRFWFFFFR